MNLYRAMTSSAVMIGFIVFLFYYNTLNLLNVYSIEKPLSQMSTTIVNTNLLLETKGCVIPDFSKTLKFIEAKQESKTCGQRAIFLDKVKQDQIRFSIDSDIMVQYSTKKNYTCCYKFAKRSTKAEEEDTAITYSSCKPFKNQTIVELEQEVIVVSCSLDLDKSKKVIYEDAYMLIKKINIIENMSANKPWNVMLVGMDTMSRARVYNTMPQTVKYLQKHKWLDFRGYQKVGFNTFPNLMAFLTGKNMSTIYKACAKGMSNCNELFMWTKFKDTGYVTAYGEDYLRLPDTFSRYKGFKQPPTDHYSRPFFLTEEDRVGNYICTKKKPSGFHLLDYAADFAETYEDDHFYGMFWLNSFSHNTNNMPALLDEEIVRFFEKLERTNILENTFIIFLSDHGIRYGEMRLPIESYYEERLPMLFMWVPNTFQNAYSKEYNNLKLNQDRLSTPYDLHLTMWDILKLSNDSVEVAPAEACPKCQGLFFEKTFNRTCEDAGVKEKWCSCHEMVKVTDDPLAKESLQLAVSYIQNKTKGIETTHCMECEKLTLKSVIRHHYYTVGEEKFYIIAFIMAPGDVAFEANVKASGNDMEIMDPTETISAYNTRGNCVKNPNDRSYCVCKKVKNCK